MSISLFCQALLKLLVGAALVGLLIFLPAGTAAFANGWLFMGVLFVPMLLAGIVMMWKNPALLAKRLNAKETQKKQGLVVGLSGLMFVVGFVVAGLDFRFSWSSLPVGVTVGAAAVFLAAYLCYAEVMRENAYLSRTIEVQDNQRVIDTGLYGVVRHPMYSVTLFLFLSMPLMLGSLYAFFVFLVYPVLITIRIKYEEELLERELDGYRMYKQRVKYRLIPFVW